MAQMGSLVVSLELQQEQFQKGMDQAARQLARAEAQSKKTQAALGGLENGMKGVVAGAQAFGAALAAIGVGRLIGQINALVDQVGALGEQADSVALTTDAFQAFSAALRDAGVNADATAALLGKAARTFGDALEGGKTQIEFFQRLNVGLLDAKGNAAPMADVMQRTAAAILAVEDPAKRVALASEFMGKSGREAIPALEQMAKGAAALSKEFENEIIPAEVIARFDAFGDKVGQMKAQVRKDAAIAINDFFTPALMSELARLAEIFGRLGKALASALTESGGASDVLTDALRNTNNELEALANWWNDLTSGSDTINNALRLVTLEVMNLNQATADAIGFLRGMFGAANAASFAAEAQHIRDQIQIMRDAAAELAALGAPTPGEPAPTVIDMRGPRRTPATGFPTPKGGGGGGKDAAEKEAEALKKRGEALAAQVDKQEALNQKLRDYDELLGKGAITQSIYEKAVAAANKELTAAGDALKASVDPYFAHKQQIDLINQAYRDGQIEIEHWLELVKQADEKLKKGTQTDLQKSFEQLEESMAGAMSGGLADFFTDMVSGSMSVAEAFNKMVKSILSDLARMLAEFAAKQAIKAIFESFGSAAGGVSASAAAAPASLMLATRPPTFNAAASLAGPSTRAGEPAPVSGGVGAAGGGGGPWNVVINNNAAGVDVSTRTRDDGALEVMVDRMRSALSQDVMRGGNPFARSLESAYGLGRGR